MNSRSVITVLLCVVLATLARSSPAGKKRLEVNNDDFEKNIDPSVSKAGGEDESEDDSLLRAKKSSTTTTFCVEIKPGTDQPAVVVCDPSKNDQHPYSLIQDSKSFPIAPPAINNPQLIPDNSPQFTAPSIIPVDPLVVVPEQPQIYSLYPQQPQIISPCFHQPQVIVIRDPNCPSNNPGLQQPGFVYASQLAPRAVPESFYAGGMQKNAYEPEEQMMRSFSAASLAGQPSNPLDVIFSRRGQQASANAATLINANQNSENVYQRPLLMQCNPQLIPLSQEAYAAATAASGGNNLVFKNIMGRMQGAGQESQFLYQPTAGQNRGMYMTQANAVPYLKQSAMYNSQQFQPGMYQNQPKQNLYTMQQQKMMSTGFGGQERAAAEANQGGIKTGHEMTSQNKPHSSFIEPGHHQGHHQGPAEGWGSPMNHDLATNGAGKALEGGQNSQSHFQTAKIGHGANTLGGGGGQALENKEQGQQKGLDFFQHQQQQQMMPNAQSTINPEKNQPQQSLGRDMSHNQLRLQGMKSAFNSGNSVQPFMVHSSRSTGDKQTDLKP